MLETDTNIKGLEAVLSQKQEKHLHTVVSEYTHESITTPKIFAVVWAIQNFNEYFYDHEVIMSTDHSAVRTILAPQWVVESGS